MTGSSELVVISLCEITPWFQLSSKAWTPFSGTGDQLKVPMKAGCPKFSITSKQNLKDFLYPTVQSTLIILVITFISTCWHLSYS